MLIQMIYVMWVVVKPMTVCCDCKSSFFDDSVHPFLIYQTITLRTIGGSAFNPRYILKPILCYAPWYDGNSRKATSARKHEVVFHDISMYLSFAERKSFTLLIAPLSFDSQEEILIFFLYLPKIHQIRVFK